MVVTAKAFKGTISELQLKCHGNLEVGGGQDKKKNEQKIYLFIYCLYMFIY